MISNTVLDAVGGTPLIRLHRLVGSQDAEVLVKWEGVNIGGSIKTRTAFAMIEDAERRGQIEKNTVIVEPTSGNQGIGLALVGAVRGYRVRIVMPDSVSEERQKLIRHYGAEVILVHDDGDIGACIRACMRLAEQMRREEKNVFLPRQFENPANTEAQWHHTGAEILAQVGAPIDGFCAGVGTGGTVTGVGRALKEANPALVVWAIEPENAAVLSGGKSGAHWQMGIGDGIIPTILDRGLIDEICTVSDEEALRTARAMAREEGIACGISGGTNVTAALRLARKFGRGKTVVTVLPDGAERYFSTPLFDSE